MRRATQRIENGLETLAPSAFGLRRCFADRGDKSLDFQTVSFACSFMLCGIPADDLTMARNQHDHFYRLARKEGYRSRAAYKLKQINSKFHVIRRGDNIVDLGAAPGGWLQMARELAGADGTVVGVDIQPIREIEGVITIVADITAEDTVGRIKELVKNADVVLCDASPNLSGDWSYDHARSIDLTEQALSCAEQILKPGGHFVVKAFHGDLYADYLGKVRSRFKNVRAHSPEASRKASAETYIIAKRFRGTKSSR